MLLWAFVFKFCGQMFSFLLGLKLKVELLGHMITLCWAVSGAARLLSKAAAPLYIPTFGTWRFRCLHILANTFNVILITAMLVGAKWCLTVVVSIFNLQDQSPSPQTPVICRRKKGACPLSPHILDFADYVPAPLNFISYKWILEKSCWIWKLGPFSSFPFLWGEMGGKTFIRSSFGRLVMSVL